MQQINQPEQKQEQDIEVDSANWFAVMRVLVNNPSSETVIALINAPNAKSQHAYVWVYLSQVIYGLAFSMTIADGWLNILLLAISFVGLMGTITFIIQNWLIQRLAIIYDGDESAYRKLHYGRGIYYPLISVASFALLLLIDIVPALQFVATWVLIVDLLLTTFLVQYINDFSYFKSSLITGGIFIAMLMLTQILLLGAM